jgi:hypothetical protein
MREQRVELVGWCKDQQDDSRALEVRWVDERAAVQTELKTTLDGLNEAAHEAAQNISVS